MKPIEVLLECVRVVGLKKEPDAIEIAISDNFDWKELQRLADFHWIRPLMAEAFRKCKLSDEVLEKTKYYTDIQQHYAISNLANAVETNKILNYCKTENIEVIPYKGLLFLNELFDNQTIRETSDIDLLFKKESVSAFIIEYLEKGAQVEFSLGKYADLDAKELTKLILEAPGKVEVPLSLNRYHYDVHWGLHYGFLPFMVNYESFFEDLIEKTFYGQKQLLPNIETQLWMIVLHNGGKENWFRLKNSVDLLYFLQKHQTALDWNVIFETAKDYNLYNFLLAGLQIVKDKFEIELMPEILSELKYLDTSKLDKIYDYWHLAVYWNTLFPRLKYERVMLSLQDKGFSFSRYLYDFYKEYSMPNPLDNDRYVSFPAQFTFLNFISKVITYGIKKFRQ